MWEYIGESIRENYYPNLPSRLNSYFIFQDLGSANYYISSNNKNLIIVEVETLKTNVLETFDMSIWDMDNNNVPYSECQANIKKYWESNNSQQMKYPEILFQGTLKLGFRVA